MKDEQLLEFSPEQARQQLNDKQLERYNELKKQGLEQNIKEQKEEDAENTLTGLQGMRQQAEGDLTVEVYGISFVADINPAQVKKLKDLEKFEDKSPEELDDNEFQKVHDSFLQILSELSVDYDRNEWETEFGDSGVMTLAQITGKLLSKIDLTVEEKKSR